MIDLAETETRHELTDQQVEWWKEKLAPYPAEAISFAFDAYLTNTERGTDGAIQSRFFPPWCEIQDRINAFMKRHRDEVEAEERRRELAERKRAVLRGEFRSADVQKLIEDARGRVAEKHSEAARERVVEDQQRRFRAQQVIMAYQFIEQLKQGLEE